MQYLAPAPRTWPRSSSGLAAAIVLAGSIGRERSEISSSLAAIEAIGGPIPERCAAPTTGRSTPG